MEEFYRAVWLDEKLNLKNVEDVRKFLGLHLKIH
jgi:hypothetical protein